jgi:hypothetical protein
MSSHIRLTPANMLGILTLITLSACGTDPESPSPDQVSGQYVAGPRNAETLGVLEITTFNDGEETDWLARGAELSMTLESNGTVSGRLFIPGADEDGGDFDEDLAGTWALTGNVVLFTQTADTFIRDGDWVWQNDRLVFDETFSDERVRVVMERAGS